MCGIVGVIVECNIIFIFIEGFKCFEYCGYDSVGVVVFDNEGRLQCCCWVGKVVSLEEGLVGMLLFGCLGIVYICWVIYGVLIEGNVYLYFFSDEVVVVYNGIIENYEFFCEWFKGLGYVFILQIDIEVIVYLLYYKLQFIGDLILVLKDVVKELYGVYGLVVISVVQLDCIVVVCSGSLLVIGFGFGENFFVFD